MSDVLSDETNEGAIVIKAPTEHPRIKINRWRVREGFPVSASQVILLYEALASNDDDVDDKEKGKSGETTAPKPTDATIHKLKAQRVGVVKKRLYKDGAIVKADTPLLELSPCIHTTVIKDMCADCGADLRQNENGNVSEASVPMVHSIPDLKVTQKLAQKLGHDDTRRLLQDRKLVLLVDLDQTVIHTTNDNVPNNIKGIYHFQLYGPQSPWYHTRLRPGTPEFLERMSKYYELHICTFGARNYAHMIAQLLDPEGKFFSHRILSRDECFNATSKTDNLKALFPNGDSMVCIIDDREDVWNMASNLIQVKPYHFFQHTGDINAPPGLSKHELDGEGVDFKEDKEKSGAKDNEKSPTSEATSTEKEIKTDGAETKTNEMETKTDNMETKSAEDPKDVDDPSASIKEDDTTPTETLSKVDTDMPDIQASEEVEVEETPNAAAATPGTAESPPTTENPTKEAIEKENSEAAEVTEKVEKEVQIATTTTGTPKDVVDPPPAEEKSPKFKAPQDPAQQIEIEDPDDYLLHLEVILKQIHARFYSIYDETKEIPDLKIIVPKIRSEVLRNCHLVFSGLVPTNMKLQQSRAYFIAKSLGAEVSQNINADTTHLVAVTAGTFKVNAAKKNPRIKIVNVNWLWSCAERWEHVEEKLFPLDRKVRSKQRQPPAHCHSPEHVVNYSDKSEISSSSSAQQNASEPEKFIDTINPLLSFSNADLADMNQEFDQFFDSDSSSEDEHVNIENPPVDKTLRKRKREENEEERTRKFFTQPDSVGALPAKVARGEDLDDKTSSEDEEDEEEEEMPSEKFRRGEDLPSDLDIGNSDSNDGSDDNNPDEEDDGDWNMMGAALEREFLGLED
ncbi:RNA polymerase II subunit A C-terminal domain phosphatase [Musca vetustissima]|uniref:RNA polymerase II subunit A C-terminal domain phosphatase n=1 Tax=Musca vetustissima TaxID=27455 RepID=UPI002AB7C78D|nr:RNA polymerase II subunit A C-terminal domain phosphatase [Musca vetustissima]